MTPQEKKCILSVAYFPSLQYVAKMSDYKNIFIESDENYIKQTYRNRCRILSANGVLTLSIPVKKELTLKTRIRDIRIDYADNWKKIHLKAVESAYGHSPYYEHYFDDIRKIILSDEKFLFDLDILTIELAIKWINADSRIKQTVEFLRSDDMPDFRYGIHPKDSFKKDDINYRPVAYNQVFSDRFSFVPDLSIIDLVFNEGPNAYQIINESIVG